MTVVTVTHHADAPTEVIEDLARSVGVFVSPTEIGDIDSLRDALRAKTAAQPIVRKIEPGDVVLPRRLPTAASRVRQLGRRLASWAASVIQTARDAASWVVNGPAIADALAARRAVQPYAARHTVTSTWYGRERSTAERSAVLHRTARQPRDPEGDLPGPPLYWVGYVARMVEVIREQDEILHPTTGHRFVCS